MNRRRRPHPRHFRKAEPIGCDQRAVADVRVSARRRRRAVGDPAIHVEQKGLHRPPVVERVVALLPDRLCRREGTRSVLSGRQQIDADVVHQRRVARAVRRRVNERCGTAPVLVLRVRVEHLRQEIGRTGVRQQAVGRAGQRIGFRRVGEREDVRRVEEVQVRMSVARRLREAVVEAAASRAGDVRHHAVEHLAVAFVAVESVVEIRAEKPSALRDAESDRTPNRTGRNGPRVGRLVLQHRDRVADRRRSQAHERRVFSRVDDLVDLVRLELRVEIHLRPIPGEAPLIARNDPALSLDRIADRQHVVGRRRIEDGVRRVIAIGERMIGFTFRDDEVAAHDAAYWLAVLRHPSTRLGRTLRLSKGRDRWIDAHEACPLRRVELPSNPQQRETLLHQKTVAHVGQRRWIEAARRVVEESEHPLAAAVRHFVEQRAVATLDSFWLDEEEVGRELDLAGRIARRVVDVRDDAVRRQRGIDGEEDLAGELLVRTGRAERLSSDEIGARRHLDPHDLGVHRCRRKREQDDHSRNSE